MGGMGGAAVPAEGVGRGMMRCRRSDDSKIRSMEDTKNGQRSTPNQEVAPSQ